jgi:hypothetical protein
MANFLVVEDAGVSAGLWREDDAVDARVIRGA